MASRVAQALQKISLGKYNSVFYTKGKNSHSSVFGGALTIAVGLLILIYSLFALVNVF